MTTPRSAKNAVTPALSARRFSAVWLPRGLAGVILVAALIALAPSTAGAIDHPSAEQHVVHLIGDVNSAAGVLYDAKASDGLELDGLDIIQGPAPGQYLGVFDSIGPNNLYVTRLASSNDLANWSTGVILSTHGSMPTIVHVSGGYLVALESASPGGDSQLEIEHFSGYANLMAGRPDRECCCPGFSLRAMREHPRSRRQTLMEVSPIRES